MVIAITGSTGNMGNYFLWALNENPEICDKIKLLCRSQKKANKLLKQYRRVAQKTEVIIGGIDDVAALEKLVAGCDTVFNICAVIPPKSDSHPKAAVVCNVDGVKNLISVLERVKENQPALVHISSVAVYGNRTGEHKYGRVGEPLVSGPFELYSATKIQGEYAVLQSSIKKWTVLRQTAIYHYNLFSDNLHDGLMFHTCFDAPLEWITVNDSGKLLYNLVKADAEGTLPVNFWRKIYNIGGGAATREYGYGTYDAGFKIIGGGFKDFFRPGYNATRNFHGMWFYDSDVLEDILHFRSQSSQDYWNEMKAMHKIYGLGKIVPKALIGQFAVKRLLNDENAPVYWVKNGDEARVTAYFGGRQKYEELTKKSWKDYDLPKEIPAPAMQSYEEKMRAYGYDIDKADGEITSADLKTVAEAHGGKLLTPDFDGDMYKKLQWQNCDGQKFCADAYTVLRAGHWEHALYNRYLWEFDRLAKTDKIFARIWYDSHDTDEDNVYWFDENFVAHVDKIK